MNPEQLLRHRDFLANLARALVSDPQEQEELLWETLGEGATTPPGVQRGEPAIHRSWLARVMRNRASNRRRARQRRLRHESSAARPEAVESVAQLASRFELVQVLAKQVQALEPDYRDAVLFRFFEDLPPREIAMRLARPVETVKTRLKRALSILRAGLDQDHGSREEWLGSLVPLVWPSAETVGVGIAWFEITRWGAVLMTMKTKAVLAGIIALLILGLGLLYGVGGPVDAGSVGGGAEPMGSIGTSEGAGTLETGGGRQAIAADRPTTANARARRAVELQVVEDRTGQAIAGAKVLAYGEDASLQESSTDARGACSFENKP